MLLPKNTLNEKCLNIHINNKIIIILKKSELIFLKIVVKILMTYV